MTNVICRLTAKKLGSALCPTLVIEYGTIVLSNKFWSVNYCLLTCNVFSVLQKYNCHYCCNCRASVVFSIVNAMLLMQTDVL